MLFFGVQHIPLDGRLDNSTRVLTKSRGYDPTLLTAEPNAPLKAWTSGGSVDVIFVDERNWIKCDE